MIQRVGLIVVAATVGAFVGRFGQRQADCEGCARVGALVVEKLDQLFVLLMQIGVEQKKGRCGIDFSENSWIYDTQPSLRPMWGGAQ